MKMTKHFVGVLCALVFLFCGVAHAQNSANPTPNPFAYTVPADTSTGTTQFTLTKQNASGLYQSLATTDTCGVKGVALETATGGTIDLQFGGLAYLKMDGSTTIGDVVIPSTTTAGY